MKSKKIRVITYLLGIISLITLASVYQYLPSQVPLHWGIDGSVRYGSKNELWLVFGLTIILAVLLDILPKIDPHKEKYDKFGKYSDLYALSTILFLNILQGCLLIEAFRPHTLSIEKIVPGLVGVLFIIIGNLMPKIKTNFFIGFKTPWTLTNQDVWNKTHRLGGKMMFGMGIAMIIAAVFTNSIVTMCVVIGGVICGVVVPLIMSYRWHKKAVE